MLTDERLAVKTDKGIHYRARDRRALKPGQLCPRAGESKKSAWAFSVVTGTDLAVPSLELHAVGMLLLAAACVPRSQVQGVAFPRAELEQGWVEEDEGEHPLPRLGHTHRSLATGENTVAERLLNRCSFVEWSFTRDQLRETLADLLRAGAILEKYRPAAQAILAAA